jgi:serine protease Do
MSLRRWFLALGILTFSAVLYGIHAQEPTPTGPALTNREAVAREAPQLTRTGARKTAVVAAVERVKNATVNIHSERSVAAAAHDIYAMPAAPKAMNGMGTGIVIDPRGYIVTNQHVVDDVTSLRIRLADGTGHIATVIARHPELDLAIIKVEPTAPLPVMPIGTAQDLMVGETVIALGNAYGYEHTVSVGVVSAIKRDVSLNKDMSYKSLIQTDACINPGNSGGPLVNINGELVGVNVAIRAGAQGIGFAIPVDHMVKSVSDMLKARRKSTAYDGLTCRDVLQQSSDGLVRKVVVDRVDAGSPAELAGLQPGDVLTQVGNVKIESGIDVERGLMDRKPGQTLNIVARRQDQEKQVQLVVADLVWQKLGVQFTPVASDTLTNVNKQLHGGLEVIAINQTGLAAKAGFKKGDVLVGLHNWETVSVENVNYVLNHPDLATFHPVTFFVLRGGQIRRGQLSVMP